MKTIAQTEVEFEVETRELTLSFPECSTKIDSNGANLEITTSYEVKLMRFSREFHKMFEDETIRCGLTMNEREQVMGAMFQELEELAIMKTLKTMIVKR